MKRNSAILALGLVLVTAITFARAVPHEFVGWDDPNTIATNPRLNPPTLDGVRYYWTHSDSGLYVPLTFTFWSALAAIARVHNADGSIPLNPWIFHAASVAVHLISTLLLFAVLIRLFTKPLAAFFGALLFAVHPLQVESVAWASGAKDVLGGMFALLMIDQFLRYVDRGIVTNYLIALLAMILGVLCKPIAIVAPAVAAILTIGILHRPPRTTLISLAPMFVVALACGVWSRMVQPAFDPTWTPLWTRPLIALDSIAFYLCKLLVPTKLAVIYGRTPGAVVDSGAIYYTWVLPAIVVVIVWQLRRTAPQIACAALVFLVGLLPVCGLTRFMFQIHSTVSDHYMYLPMLGPAIALAWLIVRKPTPPVLATIAAGLGLLAIISIIQLGYWRDSIALFSRAVAVTPHSATAESNLGEALASANRLDQAVPHFEKAVQISATNRLAHTNLAQAYLMRGEYERSAYHARVALVLAGREPPDVRNTAWERQLLARALWQLELQQQSTRSASSQPTTAPQDR